MTLPQTVERMAIVDQKFFPKIIKVTEGGKWFSTNSTLRIRMYPPNAAPYTLSFKNWQVVREGDKLKILGRRFLPGALYARKTHVYCSKDEKGRFRREGTTLFTLG